MPNSIPQNDQVKTNQSKLTQNSTEKACQMVQKGGNQLVDISKLLKHPKPNVHKHNSRHLHLTCQRHTRSCKTHYSINSEQHATPKFPKTTTTHHKQIQSVCPAPITAENPLTKPNTFHHENR